MHEAHQLTRPIGVTLAFMAHLFVTSAARDLDAQPAKQEFLSSQSTLHGCTDERIGVLVCAASMLPD